MRGPGKLSCAIAATAILLAATPLPAATVWISNTMIGAPGGNAAGPVTMTITITDTAPNPRTETAILQDGEVITYTITIDENATMVITDTLGPGWEVNMVYTPTHPDAVSTTWLTDTVPDPTAPGGVRRIAALTLQMIQPNDQEIRVSFTHTHESAIPEPATAALWASGLSVGWLVRRRRRGKGPRAS